MGLEQYFLLSGDWRYFWSENIVDFISFPQAWDSSLNTGLGISSLPSLWITSYLHLTSYLALVGLSWQAISLIFWIIPAVLISILGSYFLFNYLFPKKPNYYGWIAGGLYVGNTYFLMILFGGQVGIALAYSFVPFIILSFIRCVDIATIRNHIIFALVLSLQIFFDPRVVYITLLMCVIYFVITFIERPQIIKKTWLFFISLLIILLIHTYWLLPLILFKPVGPVENVGGISSFRFFSFGDFSHSIALLHPNWPENIFGKVSFLKPEFLITPLIAFASLLFIEKETRKKIIWLVLISFIGIFLAKGAKEPFTLFNELIYLHIPGMQLFRDSTKFLIVIALTYSLLIPYTLYSFSSLIQKKFAKKISINYVVFGTIGLFLGYWIILLLPFYTIRLTKNHHVIPKEYTQLTRFISEQPTFFRTLWIPQWQRYGFFSSNHPAIGRDEINLLNHISPQKFLHTKNAKNYLQELGVKYIIVPIDSESEIFLEDRKYSEKGRKKIISDIDSIPWLKKTSQFHDLVIYELPVIRDRFFIPDHTTKIIWKSEHPTKYMFSSLQVEENTTIIFSESFDKNWIATTRSGKIYPAKKTANNLNRFHISDADTIQTIEYLPQQYVEKGVYLTFITLFVCIIYLYTKKSKRL